MRARSAAEIALKLPEPAKAKVRAYFRRACGCLSSASKVLEAARSDRMVWLYRDQGKQARDLLAPSTAGSPGLRHGRSEGGEGAVR